MVKSSNQWGDMEGIDEGHPAVQIAVLKEQINGIRAQQAAHAQETRERLTGLETTLQELVAVMNRGKGAFAASLALSGVIGGAVVKALSFLWPTGGHQ